MRSTINSINRCWVWCGLLLSGCAGPGPGSLDRALTPDPQADRKAGLLAHVSRAVSSELDGRSAASVSNLLAAVANAPDDGELRYRAAIMLLRQSRFKEAQRLFRDAVTRNPHSERDWVGLSWAYRTPGDMAGAIQIYRDGLIQLPSSFDLYRAYVILLIRGQRLEEAVAALSNGCANVAQPLKLLESVAPQLARAMGSRGTASTREAALAQALELAGNLQARFPKEPSPTLLAADLHLASKEPSKAVELLQQRQREHPDEPLIDAKLADVLTGLDPGPEAFELIEAALGRDTENGVLHYIRGNFLAAIGDDVESRRAYEEATQSQRPSLEAFIQLAGLDSQTNRIPDAMEWLRKAESRFPGDPRPAEAQCSIQLILGRGADALASINRALELSQRRGDTPPAASVRLLRICALQEAGQPDAAARSLAVEFAEDRSFLAGFAYLALQTTSTLSRTRSIQTIAHLQQLEPMNPEALIHQGLLHCANADWTNALDRFDRADELLEEAPGVYSPDAHFYYWYGAAAERLGKWDRAANMLQNSILMDPTNGNAMNYLAYMWAEQGTNLQKALDLSRRSLRLEPDNAAYIDTLGWIYFKQGKLDAALQEIQRAANLIPEDTSVIEHLGDVHAKMGRKERAIHYWKRAFVLDPNQQPVRKKLLGEQVDLIPLEAEARSRAPAQVHTSP